MTKFANPALAHAANHSAALNPGPCSPSGFPTVFRHPYRWSAVIVLLASACMIVPPVITHAEDAKPVEAAVDSQHVDKSAWIKAFASATWFEIESSKIAMEKSSSDEVKVFAQTMIDDHSKALEKLRTILDKDGTPLPTKDLAPQQATAIEALKEAEAKDFDNVYVALELDAHRAAITLVSAYPADPALASFAKEILPTLEMHLQHVTDMAPK